MNDKPRRVKLFPVLSSGISLLDHEFVVYQDTYYLNIAVGGSTKPGFRKQFIAEGPRSSGTRVGLKVNVNYLLSLKKGGATNKRKV